MTRFAKRTPGQVEAKRQIVDALGVIGVRKRSRDGGIINTIPTIAELQQAEQLLYGAYMDHLEIPERWRAIIVAARMKPLGEVIWPNPCKSPIQYLNYARSALRLANKEMGTGNYVRGKFMLADARANQDAYFNTVKKDINEIRG
jgi:hypothetical protein